MFLFKNALNRIFHKWNSCGRIDLNFCLTGHKQKNITATQIFPHYNCDIHIGNKCEEHYDVPCLSMNGMMKIKSGTEGGVTQDDIVWF